MIGFVIVVAVMLAVALAIILPSMLRTSSPQEVERKKINVAIGRERLAELNAARESGEISEEVFERERRELEESLLDDIENIPEQKGGGNTGRFAIISVLILVPALSIALYNHLGMPAVFSIQEVPEHSEQKPLPTIEEMVAALEQRMELTPDNVEGWSMLARTYMVMGQYEKAADALYRVQSLVGENPDIMVDIADALAMQQGGQLDGEPIALLRKALALNPDQLKALWLIGMYEFQQGNAAEALVHWRKLEPMLMNDQESLQELRQLITRAESQTGQVTVQATQPAQPEVANTGALTVRVSMSPELIGQFGPDDTLFIFARAKSGSPMPLAVYRGRASELPLEVVLDDSMAMTPMMKLSAFPDVSVTARISKSGQAQTAPGDLFGMARGSVAPGQAEAVSILIDRVQQ